MLAQRVLPCRPKFPKHSFLFSPRLSRMYNGRASSRSPCRRTAAPYMKACRNLRPVFAQERYQYASFPYPMPTNKHPKQGGEDSATHSGSHGPPFAKPRAGLPQASAASCRQMKEKRVQQLPRRLRTSTAQTSVRSLSPARGPTAQPTARPPPLPQHQMKLPGAPARRRRGAPPAGSERGIWRTARSSRAWLSDENNGVAASAMGFLRSSARGVTARRRGAGRSAKRSTARHGRVMMTW